MLHHYFMLEEHKSHNTQQREFHRPYLFIRWLKLEFRLLGHSTWYTSLCFYGGLLSTCWSKSVHLALNQGAKEQKPKMFWNSKRSPWCLIWFWCKQTVWFPTACPFRTSLLKSMFWSPGRQWSKFKGLRLITWKVYLLVHICDFHFSSHYKF